VKKGKFPEFVSAIDRICDMPKLNCLSVRFTDCCVGRALPRAQKDVVLEPTTTRIRTLEAVAKAMKRRSTRLGTIPIRELDLINLQNMPLPKGLTDEHLGTIKHLLIDFIVEYEEPITCSRDTRDERLYQSEMRDFPCYLQDTLLPSVADQLVELTLAGWDWGAIPGEFNGKGLLFLRLKTLSLCGYVILRRDQFDWVLKQESLGSLSLQHLSIATHCLVLQPEFEVWGVDLGGWTRVADVPPHDVRQRHLLHHASKPKTLEPGWYVNDFR
jgi:hypothetical protein